MGPTRPHLRYLVNLSGEFLQGGQQAVYDTLRENGHPTGHDVEQCPPLSVWVTLLSEVPEATAHQCAEVLGKHGATSLVLALNLIKVVGKTEQERISWMQAQGVKLAHAPTLVRCIEKYGEYLQWAASAPALHQRFIKKELGGAQVGGGEDVGAGSIGGSHLVRPAETRATCQPEAAGQDQGGTSCSIIAPPAPIEHPSCPIRSIDESLNSRTLPPFKVVPCLGGMHASAPPSDQAQPTSVLDHGAPEPTSALSQPPAADVVQWSPVPSADRPDPSSTPPTGLLVLEEAITLDPRQRTAEEAGGPGWLKGNGASSGLPDSIGSSEEGGAVQVKLEMEVDSGGQQPQGADSVGAARWRLGLAIETQDMDALLSSLRELHALLTGPQGQGASGAVLRDEALAAIVPPLLHVPYVYAEGLQAAQVRVVRRTWLQVVLRLSELVSAGEGVQWAQLKVALLEAQAGATLVNQLRQRLEGWGEEQDDDGEGNSVVGSLLAVLSSLARHAEDHRLCEALGLAGACEAVVQALTTGLESRHATLLGASCCAMMSLCFSHSPNVGRLLELDAHTKVVQTLNIALGQDDAHRPVRQKKRGERNEQALVLASWACSCLASLLDFAPSAAARQQLQAQLGSLGVPDSLAMLLRFKGLQAEPDALVLVMAAVVALLDGSKQNQARMREAEALPALQAISFRDNSTIARKRGREACAELHLSVQRAVAMLQHKDEETDWAGGARKRASEGEEAGTEQSKRRRSERIQARGGRKLQGLCDDRRDEAQAGALKRKREGAVVAAGSSHGKAPSSSEEGIGHDLQVLSESHQPRSSSLPRFQPQTAGSNYAMGEQEEGLDELEGAPDGGIGALPLVDADAEASPTMDGDGDEGQGRGEEQGPSTEGQQATAMMEERQERAGTRPLEVEGPRGMGGELYRPEIVNGVVEALAYMLREADQREEEVLKASRALASFAMTEVRWPVSCKRDLLLHALVRALEVFADRPTVLQRVLIHLDGVTRTSVRCRQLQALGIDRALSAVMRAHMLSSDVTFKACTVVSNLAKQGCHEVSLELLLAVREARKRYPLSSTVLQAFSSLLVPGSQAVKVLVEEGGGRAIIGSVSRTQSTSQVVLMALQCISNLCLGDSETAITNRRELGSQGAIEAIDLALGGNSNTVEGLLAGVTALWALSIDNTSNVQRMRERGIAARLLWPGFQQYIMWGPYCRADLCEALVRFVVNTAMPSVELREEMGRQGACALVLNVFERPRHQDIRGEARLLTAALEAMATLCLDCPINVQRFGPAGCEALARVLLDRPLAYPERLSLPTFKALRKQACLAMRRLLARPDHRRVLLAPEILCAVAFCLHAARLDQDVPYVEAVLLALEAMTGDATGPQHWPAPESLQAALRALLVMPFCAVRRGLRRRVAALQCKLNPSASGAARPAFPLQRDVAEPR